MEQNELDRIEHEINCGERYRYSRARIEGALNALREDGIEDVITKWDTMTWDEQRRLLGAPDIDIRQQQAEEFADYQFDRSHGN